MPSYRLYTGSYTMKGAHPGIHVLSFEKGILSVIDSDSSLTNPSYVLPVGDRLYAVEERMDGAAAAVFQTGGKGIEKRLGRYEAPGSLMCHICRRGPYLYASNYLAGSLAGLREEDGGLCCHIQHEGHSADPVRQKGPHVHSALPSPDGKRLLVADLGLDRLFQYEILADGGLRPWPAQPWLETAPGLGPRHFAFHPNGRWLYLVAEMDKTLLVCRHDPDTGVLAQTAEHSLRGSGCPPEALAADVHLTAQGDFLYASVRGSDRIFAFRVKGDGGVLEGLGDFPSGGKGPRSFALSPDGRYLAAANMESGNLALFPRDQATGALGQAEASLDLPLVSCVKWAE